MGGGDGNGWVMCDLGHDHWGLNGAAGLLIHHRDAEGTSHVLLQRRSRWSHQGGTWGVPGGARDSHEDSIAAALREAEEEVFCDLDALRVQGIYSDDHGGWCYDTVICAADSRIEARPGNWETDAIRWFTLAEVGRLRLHPGFLATWDMTRTALDRLVLIVDAANVIGSRPDGWWHDRAGAVRRLRDRLAPLPTAGIADAALPGEADRPGLGRWYPEVRLVVEGEARAVEPVPGVTVIAATGSGDDAVVAAAMDRRAGDIPLVVTADRELRRRCEAVGATVTGPSWLLGLLDARDGMP
ncbi:MAG: NUDIX domain-containing protein [Streptosporangiales bacterium]|nr:NUDIX domain-containing protein [Streptosporangiales bacterium]